MGQGPPPHSSSSSATADPAPDGQAIPLGIKIFLGVAGIWAAVICMLLVRAVVLGDRKFREDVERRARTRGKR